MRRHCGPEDEFTGASTGDICDYANGDREHCGMFFDDEERSTICPHPLLWPEFPSWVELLGWCVVGAAEYNEFCQASGYE